MCLQSHDDLSSAAYVLIQDTDYPSETEDI